MSTELTRTEQATQEEIIQSLVLNGDLSKMNGTQKVEYYNKFCTSLGLNPLTQPFEIVNFQGKLKMYAKKDCTEQLRKIHSVSITDLKSEMIGGEIYKVTVYAKDGHGKTDVATGVLSIKGLTPDALSIAIMKAETKAKRRVTLSICGLGMLDESEVVDMQKTAQDAPITADDFVESEYQDVSDIPNDLIEKIKACTTKKEVKAIFEDAANQQYKELPNYLPLLKKRQAEIELEDAQRKAGTDGNS